MNLPTIVFINKYMYHNFKIYLFYILHFVTCTTLQTTKKFNLFIIQLYMTCSTVCELPHRHTSRSRRPRCLLENLQAASRASPRDFPPYVCIMPVQMFTQFKVAFGGTHDVLYAYYYTINFTYTTNICGTHELIVCVRWYTHTYIHTWCYHGIIFNSIESHRLLNTTTT